jgi:hypothetical protein
MFEQVVENLRKTTEATVGLQQEMFKRWFSLWPGVPTPGQPWGLEQFQHFQKQWGEVAQEAIKRQRDLAEAQFKAGQQTIEKAFQLGEVKTPEELRTRTIELWRQCFESLQGAHEAQMRAFMTGMEKWAEMFTRPA